MNQTDILSASLQIPDEFLNQARSYRNCLIYYECAVEEITTKLQNLDREMALVHPRNPISAIKSRIKSTESIVKKLYDDGEVVSIENIDKCLNDVAGVRVICSYIDDIYRLAELIAKQDDIRILNIKDFIKDPKPNGYRSYHMIVEVPVFLSSGKSWVKVEIQIRTIAMDFWASLEHEIRYKQDLEGIEYISKSLKECAEEIANTDQRMMDIRNRIQHLNDSEEKETL